LYKVLSPGWCSGNITCVSLDCDQGSIAGLIYKMIYLKMSPDLLIQLVTCSMSLIEQCYTTLLQRSSC